MAKIGLLNPVYAPIVSEPKDAAIVYGAGKFCGAAISASVTYTSNSNPLYGNDSIIDDDNGITGAEVTMGVDDIMEDDQVALLGVAKEEMDGGVTEYSDTGDSAPFVGFGYIQVRRKDNKKSYIANWWHKVQFDRPNETTNTKGENIEWQTDSITGTAAGVMIDKTGKVKFRTKAVFEDYAAADAWLRNKANVQA